MSAGLWWDSLLLAYKAGHSEFRKTMDDVILNQSPDVWVVFGQSMFRKIETPGDAIASDIPLMMSVLKQYMTLVDPACIGQLSVPKSFFQWLARAVSNTEGSMPLRGTAIIVSGRVLQLLPQYSKNFGVIVEAFGSELKRIASEHAGGQLDPPQSSPVVHPNEMIIHQIVDVLRNLKNLGKLKWASGFVAFIRDIYAVVKNSEAFRPQCQVEAMQIFGKLLEIATANSDMNDISAEEWLSMATGVIGAVRHAKVVHDAYQEALYNLIELAAATNLWTEDTLIACSTFCNNEIRAIVLNNMFDVKTNESLLGMIGVIYEKYSSLRPPTEGGAFREVSAPVLMNVELSITTTRDLQVKLIMFLSSARKASSSEDKAKNRKKAQAAAEMLEDIRHACADVRSSAISTAILITKAIPKWVSRCPDLFWELCTGSLRTPLLFSHCLTEEVTIDEVLVSKILANLRGALAHVEKYSIKDACNLMASISDVVSSYHYRTYLSTPRPTNELAIELVLAVGRSPKVSTKASSGDENENTLAGWKLTCCNCLQNFLKSAINVQVTTESLRVEGLAVVSNELCDLLIRDLSDIYITLHRACGLFGGPKGLAVEERAKPARLEAERMIGTSDFDAIEPLLMGLSGAIMSFAELAMLLPTASGGAGCWCLTENAPWREYESLNGLSVVIVFMRYLITSLSRPAKYENDVDLLCGDIELTSRCVDVILFWNDGFNGSIDLDASSVPGHEMRAIEVHTTKGFQMIGVLSDLALALCQKLSDIRQVEHSPLGEESKCVLFDMAKDTLQHLENKVYTLKIAHHAGDANDRMEAIEQSHAELQAHLAKERFDYTTVPQSEPDGGAAPAAAKFKQIFHNTFVELMKL